VHRPRNNLPAELAVGAAAFATCRNVPCHSSNAVLAVDWRSPAIRQHDGHGANNICVTTFLLSCCCLQSTGGAQPYGNMTGMVRTSSLAGLIYCVVHAALHLNLLLAVYCRCAAIRQHDGHGANDI
jgi:predicted CxxxxCH...CXXCH cytochrome family protein